MQLRHLPVINPVDGRLVGIITRKDLMGFNIEGKLLGETQLQDIVL